MVEPYLKLYKDIINNDDKLSINGQFKKEKEILENLKEEEEFLSEDEFFKALEEELKNK